MDTIDIGGHGIGKSKKPIKGPSRGGEVEDRSQLKRSRSYIVRVGQQPTLTI